MSKFRILGPISVEHHGILKLLTSVQVKYFGADFLLKIMY